MIHVQAHLGILFLNFGDSALDEVHRCIDKGWQKAMEVMIIRLV